MQVSPDTTPSLPGVGRNRDPPRYESLPVVTYFDEVDVARSSMRGALGCAIEPAVAADLRRKPSDPRHS
ncbi:protein of unknown function (plasmid) [Caballeronia sp. S22]